MAGDFLTDFLTRARRRELTRLSLEHGSLAATIVLAGFVALLLFGTQVLDWYWLVLLAAVGAGLAAYRVNQSVPSLYTAAQRVDAALGLKDALSTAFHFLASSEPVAARQREQAEEASRSADLKTAMPLQRPRYTLAVAVLAVVAFGLFATRYLITGDISLQPSLMKIAYDSFFGTDVKEANAKKNTKGLPTRGDDTDLTRDQSEQEKQNDVLKDLEQQNKESREQDAAEGSKEGKEKAEDSPAKEQNAKDPNQNEDSKDSKQGQPDKNGKQDSKQGGNNDNRSIMDKVKDALQNMMNKLNNNTDQEAAQNQKGQKSDQKQGNKQGDKNKEQDKTQADSDQPGEQSENQEASDQKGQKSQQQRAQDSKSGAGNQDGEKARKQAEQLAAMGQITELFGKRSQAVEGEVMIEVGNTKQTLKTAFEAKQANHAEAGGEIHRDEIPLQDQQFVKQYFEQLRKADAASASTKPNP